MPSPAPDQLTGTLRGVLEPVVAGAGFEIEDIEVRAAGRKHTVKVVVDVPEDAEETGVGLDAIARLSRSAAAELDRHEHLIAGSYTLEVTSPGIDRPLTRPLHWRRAHLRLVRVTLAGGETLEVRVGRAGPESVTVVEAGAKKPHPRELRYADVTRAVVQVEFKAPPKAEVEALDGAGGAAPGNEEQA
ncbi:ribosome maturation factor RimP [Pseudonocardia kujensis]|uniref:ribosome maturation factor RimP n=1 Tax=Pseudonocardia kujensis TaxID=1128675 RepID=UPI001E5BB13B|nr:ribosome maturation factor RimP [Pseudonocardia kujensis]MCE0765680.1 ribosome maturation factor RimP [Pseudonocardia kujensis]